MAKITNLQVREIRIFEVDDLPYRNMLTSEFGKEILESFNFSNTDKNAQNALKLIGGELQINGDRILIDELTLEPRRINFLIQGSSDEAKEVYNKLSSVIKNYDKYNSFDSSRFIVKTEQTTCVAKLNIDYEKFFSKKFLNYMKKNLTKTFSNEMSDAKLDSFWLGFSYKYELTDEDCLDYGITLNPKGFVVEPRVGSKLEDKKFFTTSPTDSKTHINILKKFEREFN